jgi:uncharacterized membrane-anchored protein
LPPYFLGGFVPILHNLRMSSQPISAEGDQSPLLPPDDLLRSALHNEVHARPTARIHLPALVVYVAVLNAGVSREQECEHLRKLPGLSALPLERLKSNFLRLRFDGYTVKWERHTEFTRYSIVQPLPVEAHLGAEDPDLLNALVVEPAWLRAIPGRTMAAIKLAMVTGDLDKPEATLVEARRWLGGAPVMASMLGQTGHSLAVSNFLLRPDGFERMLVVAPAEISDTRAGRISQRLLELETYRLMALRGLPVAKELGPMLTQSETALADIMASLENKAAADQALLDTLVSLAARVERAMAEHVYRFSATHAYDGLVSQRISELREQAVPGTQTMGDFMLRRLSPAMATVTATAQRLVSLSERVARTSALLRTRVDIAAEAQNQQLLEKLTRGQELQLRLQATVEGLSIAAISYYVISLVLYGAKAMKAAGVPINPEIAAGSLVPLVLWASWVSIRQIHKKLRTL